MKKVHPIMDTAFDDPVSGMATDAFERGRFQLVGRKQGRLLMAKIGNGELPDGTSAGREGDLLIQNFRYATSPGEGLKLGAPLEKVL
jgi:hypothetical protein